jgi:hypothetical protein
MVSLLVAFLRFYPTLWPIGIMLFISFEPGSILLAEHDGSLALHLAKMARIG